jgi:EAL domain-containing protein (putative c-di-GMP-specific phosphodiesterase class I)
MARSQPDPEMLNRLQRLGASLAGNEPATGRQRRQALDDLEAVTAAYLEARAALGQFNHNTLLPNRQRFMLDTARYAGRHDGHTVVLVSLAEAPRYHEMLCALGHAFAEDFVRAAAAIVRDIAPAECELYHISLHSLCFIVDDRTCDSALLAATMARAFTRPVPCRGVPVVTNVGVGLAALTPGLEGAGEVLRAALAAAQDSRTLSGGWSRYDRASDEAQKRVFTLLHGIPEAVANPGQFSLQFQPRISLHSGRSSSVEALLRWRHPTLGPVAPGEFIPLVEKTALISDVTGWVLEHGLSQMAIWARQGVAPMLALNISPHNLRERGFVEQLRDAIRRHRVDPARIELEFTENALTTAEPQVRAAMAEIRALGITIAIDDFGTGYSNMNYLTRLPVQILKIDQSFTRSLWEQPRQQLLVRGITDMAHALGLKVVAEGIETQEVHDLLAGWGCDEGQGYLISRPLPPDEFASWYARNKT